MPARLAVLFAIAFAGSMDAKAAETRASEIRASKTRAAETRAVEPEAVELAVIEYVLPPTGAAVARSDWGGAFRERIEPRPGPNNRANRRITGVETPSVTLVLPEGKPTAACVVCPGGGYGALAFDKEGLFIARWLADRGIAGAVLKYPVADRGDEPLMTRPVEAAHAAIRLLKQRLGVPVGVIGFSAGGHLAATVANEVRGPEKSADPALAIAPALAFDTSVAFHAMIYPVISMEDDLTHSGSRTRLIGADATEQQKRHWSMHRRVTKATSPAFLVANADDRSVPPGHSLRYAEACCANGVSVDLHLYPTGGHGYGMWLDEGTAAAWPKAFEAWLTAGGWAREALP